MSMQSFEEFPVNHGPGEGLGHRSSNPGLEALLPRRIMAWLSQSKSVAVPPLAPAAFSPPTLSTAAVVPLAPKAPSPETPFAPDCPEALSPEAPFAPEYRSRPGMPLGLMLRADDEHMFVDSLLASRPSAASEIARGKLAVQCVPSRSSPPSFRCHAQRLQALIRRAHEPARRWACAATNRRLPCPESV